MTDTPSHPPAPGDPRSPGPRPAARTRDVAWLGLAVALVVVTVVQLGLLAVRAATDPDVAATAGGLLVGFVITVVWLLTIYWLTMGSWRRTVWGCPFEHAGTAPRTRRCPRHRLLTDGELDGRQRDEAPPTPS